MHILFATLVLPDAQSTGGEIASQAFIDAIRKAGHRVSVFGFVRKATGNIPSGSHAVDVRPIETAEAGWRRYGWLARSWASDRPYVAQKFYSKRYLHALGAATERQLADVLVIDHAKMGWLVPFASQFARAVVLVAHNHEAKLYADEARHAPGLQKLILSRESRLMGLLEQQLALQVDQVWTLSSDDCARFADMAGSAKVHLLALPSGLPNQKPEAHMPAFDIGLLGTWAWDVNGRGLAWFIEQVAPLLPPQVSIRVAGRGSEMAGDKMANVRALGFVDDAHAFMRAAKVLAIPSVSGSGVQLKTIEAIAAGASTVSTTIGVRGIDAVPDFVSVADTPKAFADALLDRLSRPQSSSIRGADWAARRRHAFDEVIKDLVVRLDKANAYKGSAALQVSL